MKFEKVSIVPCDQYDIARAKEALTSAISQINGFDFIKEGMNIVIKANLVSMLKPEAAATTHPSLLCALTDILVEKGCNVVIGDSPGGLYNSIYLDRVYSATGMKEAVAHGASLNSDFSQKIAGFPEAVAAKRFEYTAFLDKADAIINFCKLKTHGMMGMSAAVKNMFGVIPGTFKPEYHFKYPRYEDFANMLVDLNEYFKPALCIVDAVEGMEGNGPTMGTPRSIGAIAVSKSPYMLDLLCAHLIGLSHTDVPTLEAAFVRGLAPSSISSEYLCGDAEQFVINDFKNVPVKESLEFKSGSNKFLNFISPVAASVLRSKPILKKKKECIGCGKCASICPAKAITMKNKKPVIDRNKCIRCFCCQEFCPKGALTIHRTLIARLLNRTKSK